MSIPSALLVLTLLVPGPADDPAQPQQEGGKASRVDVRRFLTNRENPLQLPLPEEEDSFFFLIYGDRTGGPAEGVEVLREAVAETNLLGPDLVLTVGDLIQGYNHEEPWMGQMREYRGIMEKLDMPWFPVAGNHDVYFRPEERGGAMPPEEHEARYEMHFGPLWYAFRHKSAWFIVLYTDEPNPETGERNFNKPESQRMSPEQLGWLDETLEVTKDAEHVFVFCHHPRWIGGNYGDDWERVHERLVKAGNVTAVFGGHIHHMRYDPRDGIEYFALATVGGHIGGTVPEAGSLHCFDIVTVRPGGIQRATIPVGATMDPREITAQVAKDAPRVYEIQPHWLGELALQEDGSVDQNLGLTLTNPTKGRVEAELRFVSPDPRWTFAPDHVHGVLEPSGTLRVEVRALRPAGPFDGGFGLATLDLGMDYLTQTARFAIPRRELSVPFDLASLPPQPVPAMEHVLVLAEGGESTPCVRVPSESIELPEGSFTLEAWVRAERFQSRQALVAKTQGSEYGFFANDGRLEFSVHMQEGGYASANAGDVRMRPNTWHHVAGVYDDQADEVRVYLDGALVGRAAAKGPRTRNALPLLVGADPDGRGRPTSGLTGAIDEVHLALGALHGEDFDPDRRTEATEDTVLLLHMDGALGPFVRGGVARGAELQGGARVTADPTAVRPIPATSGRAGSR